MRRAFIHWVTRLLGNQQAQANPRIVPRSYTPPKTLRSWTLDIPGGDLYELFLFENGTICAATGRYAHASGSTQCSWKEFSEGKLHDLIRRTMGDAVLTEALDALRAATPAQSGH